MEHGPDRTDDLLQRGRSQHTGASRSTRQVRKQNPDPYKDRTQLQDAEQIPSGGVLYSQGAGRAGHAVYGPCANPPVGPAVVQTDGCRHHPLPLRHESRWGPTYTKLVQVCERQFYVTWVTMRTKSFQTCTLQVCVRQLYVTFGFTCEAKKVFRLIWILCGVWIFKFLQKYDCCFSRN